MIETVPETSDFQWTVYHSTGS